MADGWDAVAADWAEVQQYRMAELWSAALTLLDPRPGELLLDVGCGAGGLAQLAVTRGSRVVGVDVAPAMLRQARRIVPSAGLARGTLDALPFASESCVAAVCINAVQFAPDPPLALAELGRVLRPHGRAAVSVWGPPERCAATPCSRALRELSGLPPGRREPDRLAEWVRSAGLVPVEDHQVTCTWSYSDAETLVRGMLASPGGRGALEHAGRARVVDTVLETCAPYANGDGSYALPNVMRLVLCRREGTAEAVG